MPTNADGIIERGLARLREDIEQKLKSHAKRIEEAKIEIDESQRRQAVRKEFEALFGQCVVRGSDPPTVDLTLEGVPVEMARELAIWLKAKGYPRGEAQEQEQEQEQES